MTVGLKDLLTKFDRVYDNQKGDQYKLKGTFGEDGFFTREEAEQIYEKMSKVIYQKGLEPGMVQTEFPSHKTVIKPLGKENIVKSTRKTELDFFGVETSDRPHLESFGVDVTEQMKRVDEIIDKIDECYDKGCGNLGGLISEAKTELKKLPILKPDEEIIEVKCENPPRCASGPRKAYVIIEDKTYAANCVSPTTATRIHNQHYKKYFPMDSHSLKCNDNFTVKDDKIKLISFFGSEPVFIVFASGEKQYPPIKAKYKLE